MRRSKAGSGRTRRQAPDPARTATTGAGRARESRQGERGALAPLIGLTATRLSFLRRGFFDTAWNIRGLTPRSPDLTREIHAIHEKFTISRSFQASSQLRVRGPHVCVKCCTGEPAALTDLQVYPARHPPGYTFAAVNPSLSQATYADGITRDVTAEAKATLANPALVKLEKGVAYPLADGTTEMKVEFGGRAVAVPVQVKNAKADRPISFKLDVMPVFMKAGCNQGSCHGAARGKDGFRLSLFGFDPDGDHYRLTHEINGRRVNLALPRESLLLEKATGRVPHTGGTRFTDQSELYQTLLRWLEVGAPQDPPGLPTPVGLELLPKNAVLDGKGTKQRMVVRARYSDGSDRDVTLAGVIPEQ